MKNKKVGRPVALGVINIDEIENWMDKNPLTRKAIICQSIIALHNGAAMIDVCNVLNVTRESVRLWKNRLQKNGLNGLLKTKKVGKRSKLTEEKRQILKQVLKQAPQKHGYEAKKWNGNLMQQLVYDKWNYHICLRTAQMWLKKIR